MPEKPCPDIDQGCHEPNEAITQWDLGFPSNMYVYKNNINVKIKKYRVVPAVSGNGHKAGGT